MCSSSLKRPVVQAWRSSCLTVARSVFNSIHVLYNTLTVEEVSGNLIYCVIASWWPVFFPSCGFSLYRLELLRSGPSGIFQLDFGIYKSVIIFYHSNTTSALLQECFLKESLSRNMQKKTTMWFDLFCCLGVSFQARYHSVVDSLLWQINERKAPMILFPKTLTVSDSIKPISTPMLTEPRSEWSLGVKPQWAVDPAASRQREK